MGVGWGWVLKEKRRAGEGSSLKIDGEVDRQTPRVETTW